MMVVSTVNRSQSSLIIEYRLMRFGSECTCSTFADALKDLPYLPLKARSTVDEDLLTL